MPRDPTCVLSVLCHATYVDPETRNTVVLTIERDDPNRREKRQEGTTDDDTT